MLFGLEFDACSDRRHFVVGRSAAFDSLQRDFVSGVSALFIEYSPVIVNGTKDPVALGSVKYFWKEGTDTLQIVVIVVRPTYRSSLSEHCPEVVTLRDGARKCR
jgi:hypothetical protein